MHVQSRLAAGELLAVAISSRKTEFPLVPKLLFGNAVLETPFREGELLAVAICSRKTEF